MLPDARCAAPIEVGAGARAESGAHATTDASRTGGGWRNPRFVPALAKTIVWAWFFGLLFAPVALAQSDHARTQSNRSANMTVLRTDSSLYAVTHRAGLFGFLGHEHAITAQDWSARLCYLEDDVGRSFIEMTLPTASLLIDTERGRELAGLESSPDASTIEDLQDQMLSDRFLNAEAFPELTFVSTSVARGRDGAKGSGDGANGAGAPSAELEVTGDLTIHGRTTSVTFPVLVERRDTGSFRFDAHVTFRMTEFGIAPENTAGVVAVADEMDLYLSLVAQRTSGTCD